MPRPSSCSVFISPAVSHPVGTPTHTRKKDRLSVPWGEGDTPVTQVLQLIRDNKYPIRCYLDCDHKTTNRPADVKRSFEYAKTALG